MECLLRLMVTEVDCPQDNISHRWLTCFCTFLLFPSGLEVSGANHLEPIKIKNFPLTVKINTQKKVFLLSFVPGWYRVSSFQKILPTWQDDGDPCFPDSFLDIGRQFHGYPRYAGKNLTSLDLLISFLQSFFYWFSVNEMQTAQMGMDRITASIPCVKDAFHVSKCFIAALQLP